MNENVFENMDAGAYRIAYLIAGYIRKSLTSAEHDELDTWVEVSDENMLLFEELTDEKNIEANLAWMDKVRTEQMLQATKQKIKFTPEGRKIKSSAWIYAVAASIILLLGIFSIIRITTNQKNRLPVLVKEEQKDIQPGGNKATLTFSDGTSIDLSGSKSGLLKIDDGAVINKSKDGEIVYTNGSNTNNNQISYNVLSTPKGGQFKVQLPDASFVWLNASSSLKYPTAFTGTERTVELTGEGYFEVAKDRSKPFIVKIADEVDVKVMGTHFNIMSYKEEKVNDITLLEGLIEINHNTETQMLKPGQQAQIISGEIHLNTHIDTMQIVGWKNGQFVFHDADIQTIMKQINRWYDVEIKYKGKVNQQFNAVISRNEPVSRLLHLLEGTGQIHFKIENKIIYVLP